MVISSLMKCIITDKQFNQINIVLCTNKENDSQIVRAKENLKLSHGGPNQRQTSGTNQWIKILLTYCFLVTEQRTEQMSIHCILFGYFVVYRLVLIISSLIFRKKRWIYCKPPCPYVRLLIGFACNAHAKAPVIAIGCH